MVPAPDARSRLRWRDAQVQRRFVDDEPAAARVEGRDDRSDRGQVELTEGPAPDDVDLGLSGPVHVGHGAEEPAVRSADLGPDDLVPPGLARFELGVSIDDELEVGRTEALGSAPIVDLLEPEAPAGAVLDGRGGRDRQRRVAALGVEDPADGEAVLGVVREDLDANEAPQAVRAADPPDDDASQLAQRRPLRGSRA